MKQHELAAMVAMVAMGDNTFTIDSLANSVSTTGARSVGNLSVPYKGVADRRKKRKAVKAAKKKQR